MSKKNTKSSAKNYALKLYLLELHQSVGELRDFVRQHGPEVLASQQPYHVLLEVGDDPRLLREIPGVRELCQRVMESGALSLLAVNLGDERSPLMLGAADIFALANALPHDAPFPLPAFLRSLERSNDECDRVLEEHGAGAAACEWPAVLRPSDDRGAVPGQRLSRKERRAAARIARRISRGQSGGELLVGGSSSMPSRRQLSSSDEEMLRAGRSAVDQAKNLSDCASDGVLVVVDLNDIVGFQHARFALELSGTPRDSVERILEDLRSPPDAPRGHRGLFAFWAPRTGLLPVLGELGFAVPPEWLSALAHAPAPGRVWTLLKRGGAGLLLSVEYATIPRSDMRGVVVQGGVS